MKIKSFLLTALMSLGCTFASAQEQQVEYEFQPHWYVQAQVGGQYTLGEIGFSDLLSPTAQIGVGYNFNKVMGARLAINAWQSKGGSEMFNDTYKWDWKYVAPTVDLTANLSNLFCGVNPNRVVDFGVFAGVGANIAFSNDKAQDAANAMAQKYGKPIMGDDQYVRYLWDGTKTRFIYNFGANVDFKVSDAVSLGLEVSATSPNDHYNSKKAGNPDWYFNAMAGVKINLGKTYTTKIVEPYIPRVDTVKIIEKVNVPAPVVKDEPIRRDVFFMIRSTVIDMKENVKVNEIADYMQKHPNTKVRITGYADKGTGNAVINRSLSEKRARVVADALINKHNISSSRIITDAKGDTVQPFAENDLNRVSICIVE